MSTELGAKKDIYTSSRCMLTGILLGRMAASLADFRRALDNKKVWSPAYMVSSASDTAYRAAEDLNRFLPTARPELKQFMEPLKRYKDETSSFGFNKEQAEKVLTDTKGHLSKISQIAVQKCGKRRPEEGEGDALLEMKTVKRVPWPKPAPPAEIVLPIIVEPPLEAPKESGTPWGVIAGVAMLIGAAFLMR